MKKLLKLVRKIRRAITRDEPGYYDMFLNEGERFFARLYLHFIRKVLKEQGAGSGLKLLDAGCQAGRLAIPLAKDGHRVTGVDTSGVAIRKAGQHARESGVSLQWVRADLGLWLPKQPAGSFDVVVCNEVLYLRDNWRELLHGLLRLVRPGGLCFISHRPPSFAQATESGEGKVDGSYYNWQDRDELGRLYQNAGIELLEITPIGLLADQINPEGLTAREQEELFQKEIKMAGEQYGDGRYLLVCGRKK